MQKIALTILGALLISGSAIQMATARQHHLRKAHLMQAVAHDQWAIPQTRSGRNIENFGFSGRDRSRVGGWSPYLRGE